MEVLIGYLKCCFPSAPQRLFGEDLPLQQNGFVSATELVSAMIDTFHLKPADDDSGQHWIVRDILHSDIKQSGVFLQLLISPSSSQYVFICDLRVDILLC